MHEIRYGKNCIHFELLISKRKTLEISVWPDGQVIVKAPADKSIDAIVQRVRKRAPWILKQQAYFKQFESPHPPREYVSGESFRYLGKQYRLKVIDIRKDVDENDQSRIKSNSKHRDKERVKLMGGYLRVFTQRNEDPEYVKQLVDRWYRQHAERKFVERMRVCQEIMRKHGVGEVALEIRMMKNRWGSCTPKGKILLNPRLIEFPTYCIDYVILHELCHILYPHHGKAFYRLLNTVLPEWENIRMRLNKNWP
ncbi:MAG: M48 family peptidase [Calditrichaeota bacterium]|nr:MAG: M48 family peptidase [Calditrichota bacterium]